MKKKIENSSDLFPGRVVVRPQVSWQSRLRNMLLVCLLLLLLSWVMFEMGRRSTGEVDAASLIVPGEPYHMATCSKTKRKNLCAQLAELTRQFQISQTTNDDLVKQTGLLSKENNRLKQELDFFEHVMTGNTKLENGIAVHQFSLKKDGRPQLYRYTVSLVQGGQRPKDFKGTLKFFVNLRQNDQRRTVLLTNKEAKQNFPIHLKFYHRIEESFKVPPDTIVESIKVEVFKQGDSKVLLTQTVELSK